LIYQMENDTMVKQTPSFNTPKVFFEFFLEL